MRSVFSKDLYRYYGDRGEPFLKRIMRYPELKYIFLFRKVNETRGLLRIFYEFRLRMMSRKTFIQIPSSCKIGEGFYIGHYGRIIINPDVVLGKNVNIATGVTIGQENRGQRKGVPTIGDRCWIGTNAVIVGNIKIGSDVLIAPLAYVNFDIPDHSIVIGNPAKIIHRENATEGYIENVV